MRTHYGPWQPYWISNQHQKHKSGRGPSSEHFWQVWLISVQRFQRRRFKCEKLTDGRTTDAYPWQKLTWPMARWAKNNYSNMTSFFRFVDKRAIYRWYNLIRTHAAECDWLFHWQHNLCARFSANANINYRLPIKVYYRICTLRHIRIEIWVGRY